MPDNWVTTEPDREYDIGYERKVSAQLRQAYRTAETGRTEAEARHARLRDALEIIVIKAGSRDGILRRVQEALDDDAS